MPKLQKCGDFMNLNLLSLALAPIFIAAFYIYFRDKYEKEPLQLLFLGLFFGAIITVPIVKSEHLLTGLMPEVGFYGEAFYLSFVVASFTEEIFKLVVVLALSYFNPNFNEPFDGIVYAVFVSLGFAMFENVLYVFNEELGGYSTALVRSVFSVPAHALFGVLMGYYLSYAKFQKQNGYLALALIVPVVIHGLYDFILLANMPIFPVFILFLAYLWYVSFKKINALSRASKVYLSRRGI